MAYSATGTRLNRRGIETRQHVLAVAVQVLSTGGPESMSANLIAKEAGVTWGTIQHQFGDSDGVWAAVLDYMREGADNWLPESPARNESTAKRIRTIVESLWSGYHTPVSKAVQNLRASLPRDQAVFQREFPRTATALELFEKDWNAIFDRLFVGLGASRTKLRHVRSLLPGAVFGLYVQQQLITTTDAGEARRCLTAALVAYLDT